MTRARRDDTSSAAVVRGMTQESQGYLDVVDELVTSSRQISTLMASIRAEGLRGLSPQEQADLEDLADAAAGVLDETERHLQDLSSLACNRADLVLTVQAANRVMARLRERVIDHLVADSPAPDHP